MTLNPSWPSTSISPNNQGKPPHIVIIGGGFTGLTAAYDLTRKGYRVSVLERDEEVGGLAGSFEPMMIKLF